MLKSVVEAATLSPSSFMSLADDRPSEHSQSSGRDVFFFFGLLQKPSGYFGAIIFLFMQLVAKQLGVV